MTGLDIHLNPLIDPVLSQLRPRFHLEANRVSHSRKTDLK